MSFKSIAIAGAQSPIGKAIVFALANMPGVSSLVLTRAATPRPAFLPKSVAHAGIDYANVDATEEVLREHKVEVVICAINSYAILEQIPLADAAKAAGVQLFVPSEFGTNIERLPKDDTTMFLQEKVKVAEHLEAIGLPYLRIFTGIFHEWVQELVGYVVNKKVNLVHSVQGDTPFASATCDDIGGFVAHVVTHHPLSTLANKCLRIEGDRLTLNGLGAILDAPVEKVDEVPAGGQVPSVFLGQAQILIETGRHDMEKSWFEGDSVGVKNGMWEGHHWTSYKEYLKL